MIDTKSGEKNTVKPSHFFEQVVQQYRGMTKAPELALKYGEALYETGGILQQGSLNLYADAYAFAPKVRILTVHGR
jgi:hypothetical protein